MHRLWEQFCELKFVCCFLLDHHIAVVLSGTGREFSVVGFCSQSTWNLWYQISLSSCVYSIFSGKIFLLIFLFFLSATTILHLHLHWCHLVYYPFLVIWFLCFPELACSMSIKQSECFIWGTDCTIVCWWLCSLGKYGFQVFCTAWSCRWTSWFLLDSCDLTCWSQYHMPWSNHSYIWWIW